MKRFLCLVISISILISLCPVITFGADAVLGTESNPVVIGSETSYVFYEAENYPEGTNYKTVSDSDNQVISRNETIDYSDLSTTGDNAQYRLWIKSENEGKIKIFLRMKTTSGNKGVITCAKNNDPVMDRTFYFKNNETYYWFCPDSYEVDKNETFAFSVIFSQNNLYVDKIFITSDLMAFPEGTNDVSNTIDFSYMADAYGEPEHKPISTHPRLFINSESIESVKANLKMEENISAYNSLIGRADTDKEEISPCTFENAKGYILSNAFLSVISDEDDKETRANNAIDTLLESLKLKSGLETNRSEKENLNEVIYRIFFISLVYDWCYDYLEDNKDTLISNILFYMAQQEYTYPPINVSGINNGHESEGDFFAALLPASIAIYDEYHDMYNLVGAKVLKEHVPTRNYYYEKNTHAQGSHYMRMTYEFYLRAILDSAVGKGIVNDGADSILMEYVFGLRPDNQIMRNGDHNAAGSRNGIKLNSTALFYNSNYHNNSYLKDLYYRITPKQSFGYGLTLICEPLWLIFNNPTLEPKSYTELPLTYYAGDDAGVMYARTSWEMGNGDNSNQMAVRMNLETIYGAGHDHLDAGHFDIYYKGSLALDSGHYNLFTSEHNRNYYQRTIAHNSMLLYDKNEVTTHRGKSVANDGGQIHKVSAGADNLYEAQKIGEILAVDYGEDMYNPSFTYMKGDLTDAYSPEKMKNYTRSFVFLNFFDDVHPGALIVFDKMISKDASFTKKWLLHTQEEPTINGNTVIVKKTEEGDNGRLINTTLLPKSDDAKIEKVGGIIDGVDLRFSVNKINFDADMSKHAKDYGEWRVELSPITPKETDTFLNVLQVSENDDSIEPLTPELIDAGDFQGVKIKNRIVLFNTSEEDAEKVKFTFEGNGEYEILVAGVSSGKWTITSSDATKYDSSAIATENGSDLYFKGTAGTYFLRKDIYSSDTLTRNLDYTNYINESDEEYSYIRFNGIYHSAPFFEQDDKLFVGVQSIAKYLNISLEDTSNSIKFEGFDYELLKDSEDVILKDNIYYVSADALRDFFVIDWVKENDYIYNLTLRNIYKITNGNEFVNTAFTDPSGLYIIAGEDRLYDGSEGIELPENYETKPVFAGVIKGIEGKNNIEIKGTQPLFYECKDKYYAKISDLTLKGNNITFKLNESKQGFGILICRSKATKDLVLKNITNYLDVEFSDDSEMPTDYIGGLIGYRQDGDTYIENCVNHGNINVNSDLRTGGIIGCARSYYKDVIIDVDIKNSYNYGDISNNAGVTGGIYGDSYNKRVIVNVENCGNYGNISSNNCSGGVGGIIGKGYTVNVSGTFNSGTIIGKEKTGGIVGCSNEVSQISNSFNTGKISSSLATGIAYKNTSTLTVDNCYNTGEVTEESGWEISNTTLGSSNYYINENANGEKNKIAELKEPMQITETNDIFQVNNANENEQVTDPDTNEPIMSPYFIVPVKFSYFYGLNLDKERDCYGIFLSETEFNDDNSGIEIKGNRHVNTNEEMYQISNFGILVYGNKVITGKTYYVRPYVKYNGEYYCGTGNSFVFEK